MHSIRRTLLAWILGALSLGVVLAAVTTYLIILEEMNDLFDDNLRDVADAVASLHGAARQSADLAALQPPVRTDAPEETEIVTLAWTADGKRIYSSDPRIPLPFIADAGLSRPVVDGQQWVVYSSVHAGGIAQAAQRAAARKDMADEFAVKALPPLLGLVTLTGAFMVFALRRGLQPLDATAQDVARRSVRSLEAIALNGTPREIVPLVAAVNGLMQRLNTAFAAQRRFLADAAHELRTPVTAIRLQLQRLQRATGEADRQSSLAELAAGVDRTQRLVEQLLRVARTEPDGEPTRADVLDLAELARSCVARFNTEAEHARLDLGAVAPDAVPVVGDAAQLTVLLDNLVENAVRYTPMGGVVNVIARLEQGRPVLRVTDNGPGIPASERERVFERFHRGEAAQSQTGSGSGLGLAIVKAIAERHGTSVELLTPAAGAGLEVCIRFAAA